MLYMRSKKFFSSQKSTYKNDKNYYFLKEKQLSLINKNIYIFTISCNELI